MPPGAQEAAGAFHAPLDEDAGIVRATCESCLRVFCPAQFGQGIWSVGWVIEINSSKVSSQSWHLKVNSGTSGLLQRVSHAVKLLRCLSCNALQGGMIDDAEHRHRIDDGDRDAVFFDLGDGHVAR